MALGWAGLVERGDGPRVSIRLERHSEVCMTMGFSIGTVLSITTGRLVSPDGIGGVYRICDYMLDTNHFTHQLPRAARECAPHLIAQYPDLAAVEAPAEFEDEAHIWRWVGEQADRFGAELEVARVHEPVARDPIGELVEMRGGSTEGIIIVSAEDDDA